MSVTGETASGSIVAALLAARDRAPDRPLVSFAGRTYSYGLVSEAAAQAGGALVARGVRPGDRVALVLENSPGFVIAYLGVYFARAVAVPVNVAYRKVELAHILTHAGARVCIADAPCAALVRALQRTGELVSPSDLLEQHAAELPAPALGPDDLALIGYTSGTTGRAKGAMLTHGNFLANAQAVTAAWGWTDRDRLLCTLPLFHMHGLGVGLHGSLVAGSAIDLHQRFDPGAVLDEFARDDVTLFFGVPTMYVRLLQTAVDRRRPPRLGRVRLLVSGSAPLSAQLFEELRAVFGQMILERYGMTETVMIAGNPLVGERRPGAVGWPFAGVALRVVDPRTRAPLAAGETGEVEVQGSSVCRGYWDDPDATREAFSPDGWFRTGDLGWLAPDGCLTLCGRARELIISGGFNVYPREVEDVLARHPLVAEVAVVGQPDAELGEAVIAVVVPHDPSLSAADLVEFSRTELASFKKPRRVYFVDRLPRNALGKIQKHLVRAMIEGR
jgi:malonyl-CoA/methylmalonyl-CoA synthetase